MIMHAALSSVNFGLNSKPSEEKKSIDFFKSRTARLTKMLCVMRSSSLTNFRLHDLGHLAELPNFAFAHADGGQEALAPLDRLSLLVDLDYGVSVDVIVPIRERSIAHRKLSRVDSNAGTLRAGLEPLGAEQHAGLSHLLHQVSDSFHLLRAGGLVRLRLSRSVKQYKPHTTSSFLDATSCHSVRQPLSLGQAERIDGTV